MNKIILITLTILILDYLWLKYAFGPHFINMIQRIQSMVFSPKFSGAIVAYLSMIYIITLLFPRLNNVYEAILLGLSIYAIYDGTNYATITNWDINVAIPDTIWGGFLFGIIYYIFYTKKLLQNYN